MLLASCELSKSELEQTEVNYELPRNAEIFFQFGPCQGFSGGKCLSHLCLYPEDLEWFVISAWDVCDGLIMQLEWFPDEVDFVQRQS